MRWWITVAVGLAVLVQSYFLSALSEIAPNLVLITLLYFGFKYSFARMLPLALLAGLILDAMSGTAIGSRVFLYAAMMLIGASLSRSGLEISSRFRFVLVVVTLNIILEAGLMLMMWLDLKQVVWQANFFWLWASRSLWTGIFAWFMPRPLK